MGFMHAEGKGYTAFRRIAANPQGFSLAKASFFQENC